MGRAFWSESDALAPLRWLAPWGAALLLVGVLALALTGTLPGVTSQAAPAPSGASDARLYEHVIDDVAGGQAYYPAAARELRLGGYPLQPFMAVRPPLLTVALARLPGEGARRAALALLIAATFAAWAWRLRETDATPLRFAATLLLLASGVAMGLDGKAYTFHEVWAGLLISLSLAVYRPERWALSVALGLAAALARELAVPYLCVMALFALLDRRRWEAAAWSAALGVVAIALALHAAAVSAVVTPLDAHSPGWLGLGGWPFVLRTARWNTVLLLAPVWLSALTFAPALLGLLFWRGSVGRRSAAVVLGYVCGFCVIGRPDNAYWGLLIAPLWPLGLAEAGGAVTALRGKARLAFPPKPGEAAVAR